MEKTDRFGGSPAPAFASFLELVGRLSSADLNRSENDLSANLKSALSSFGLYAVLDTSGGSDRRRRPDISLYTELAAADTGAAADVVVEAKKPAELAAFATMSEALTSAEVWNSKFLPYVK